MLYLYFASNANGYVLALSPAAIRQAVGMAASTYRDQFLKLVDKGYLVQRGSGNTYDFYETPQRETRLHNENTPVGLDFTAAVQKQAQAVQKEAPEDIEININNTNIKNRGVEKQVSPTPSNQFYF